MPGITFFDICQEEMVVTRMFLEERFIIGSTVPGTRSSHHFVPITSSKIGHKLCSDDQSYVSTHKFDLPTILNDRDIVPMQYVTCVLDSVWWVGMIESVDGSEVAVKLMHPKGGRQNSYTWRQVDNTWFIHKKNILCIVSPTTPTGRTYRLTDEECKNTITAFELHKKNNV